MDTKPCLITAPGNPGHRLPSRAPRPSSRFDHFTASPTPPAGSLFSGKALGAEAVTFSGYANSKKDSLQGEAGALLSKFMWILCDLTFLLEVGLIWCLEAPLHRKGGGSDHGGGVTSGFSPGEGTALLGLCGLPRRLTVFICKMGASLSILPSPHDCCVNLMKKLFVKGLCKL